MITKREYTSGDAQNVSLYAKTDTSSEIVYPITVDNSGQLKVAMVQRVEADNNNSSTTNLTAANSRTFTGLTTSTLGIAGIQVSLYANQNCTVQVQQSPDSTHWDLKDTYNYYDSTNFGITVQAISSWLRVVVTCTSPLTTSTFRLQTALCPVVEAVPRSLDADGHLQVSMHGQVDEYGFEAEYTPMGEQRVAEPTRLVGAIFDGTTLDENFWVLTTFSTGAITVGNSEISLATGADTSGSIKLNSVRRGRYVSSNANRYRAVVRLLDEGMPNNARKWGIAYGATMPTVTDGAYFLLTNTTFALQTIRTGTTSTIASGSFNGTLGKVWTPSTTIHTYEIYWTNSSVWFTVDGDLLHKFSATTQTWADTMSHYLYIDNTNTGSATSATIKCRVQSISRLGKPETAPAYKNINTATVTTLALKRSAGRLHRVCFNTIPNTTIIKLYDSVATTANSICVMNPPNGATPFTMNFGLDFYNGLTITTTPKEADVTIIYE